MLLHYVGNLINQYFADIQQIWRQCKRILIFLVFNIASLSPYLFQRKFLMSLFFYLFTFAINLWLQKFVPADVTAVFVNNQRGIQQWAKHFDKKVCICRGTQQRGWQTNFLRKAGQSMVLISCWKRCGTQAPHSWQSHKTLALPAFFRATHILPKNN